MALNFATAITARQWYASMGDFPPVPAWFRHTPAGSQPTPPAFPSTLTTAEQNQVTAWLAANASNIEANPDFNLNIWDDSALSLTNAISKAGEYKTYYTGAAWVAWKASNRIARWGQWRWYCADALDATAATVAVAADSAGTGSGGTGSTIPHSTN
jgi:hypothetical protein